MTAEDALKPGQALAIIVPAYRAAYLEPALDSIVAQTDQRFNLYVFDDASPDAIEEVADRYASGRPLRFKRFEDNVGGRSVPAQWERCIAETTEPWIWLFSDDDVMEAGCVARFYEELGIWGRNHDLYRFSNRWVDAQGQLLQENEPHPIEETGSDFLFARLRIKRASTMQELVFAREAYEKIGGIPEFPLAWGSDDAFITKLGLAKPIRSMTGPRISWRRSGLNISTSYSATNAKKKIAASRMYAKWATDYLTRHPPSRNPPTAGELEKAAVRWFFYCVSETYSFLDVRSIFEIDAFCTATWGWAGGKGLMKCCRANYSLAKRRLVLRTRQLLG